LWIVAKGLLRIIVWIWIGVLFRAIVVMVMPLFGAAEHLGCCSCGTTVDAVHAQKLLTLL
jgi:hypothetical protein